MRLAGNCRLISVINKKAQPQLLWYSLNWNLGTITAVNEFDHCCLFTLVTCEIFYSTLHKYGRICSVRWGQVFVPSMTKASTSSAPICSSCCMVSKEISLNSTAMPMNVSRRIFAMFCSWDRPGEQHTGIIKHNTVTLDYLWLGEFPCDNCFYI